MNLLAKGFRPFFLLGGAFATGILPLWLVVLGGHLAPRGPLQGATWHAHEMIFGFTTAIVAGFLLTAVSNWTGRETATGALLGALALVWTAGRVALLLLPGWPAAVVDLLFLPAVGTVVGRVLWRSSNRRNAAFPFLLLALWTCDVAVFADALGVAPGLALPALRAAVHLLVVVLLVITGRIVPLFTRNATGAVVATDRVLDKVAIGAALSVALLHLGGSPVLAVQLAAGIGAIAVFGRARGWGLRAALHDPLLWVLHLGHAWVGLGLLLESVGPWLSLPPSLAIHALTVGALGMSTLGMMARVSLGHTGRPLRITPAVTGAFAAMAVAAVVRVATPLLGAAHTTTWLWVAGSCWSVAFANLDCGVRAHPGGAETRRATGLNGEGAAGTPGTAWRMVWGC